MVNNSNTYLYVIQDSLYVHAYLIYNKLVYYRVHWPGSSLALWLTSG